MFMKNFTLSFLLLFIHTLAFTQTIENKIDSLLLKTFKDKNGPGGVFLISKAGKPIYQKAFGMANIELDVDMNTENVFQLGSITKQFTAVAILMLHQQQKLNVTDPISKYIPDYPAGNKITIHHLLTHTSGIKDFTKMKALNEIAQKDLSPLEMVNFFKNEAVDFKPGEKFEYNNSGYVILGYLIELVTGDKYANYIQKNIFDQLAMVNSRYASDRMTIKNRAYGYQKKGNDYVNKTSISFNIPYASGALMSTVTDMVKWQNAISNHKLLNKEMSNLAFTKKYLNDGSVINYGYGWHLSDINGRASREHGGSIFGFKTMGVYIPNDDIYVIGLSNCDCNSPTQVTRDIAKLVLDELKGSIKIN